MLDVSGPFSEFLQPSGNPIPAVPGGVQSVLPPRSPGSGQPAPFPGTGAVK